MSLVHRWNQVTQYKLIFIKILDALNNKIQYKQIEGHCYITTMIEGISSDVCNITALSKETIFFPQKPR